MAIAVGQNAPEITLFDEKKDLFTLSSLKGKKNVVLLFFPGAFTRVCTTELNTVNNDLAAYGADTQVVGISTDSPFVLAEFKRVNAFSFPLLSDHNAEAAAAYHAKYMGDFTPMKLDRIARRAAFVVDKEGKVVYAEVLESAGALPDLDTVKAVANG